MKASKFLAIFIICGSMVLCFMLVDGVFPERRVVPEVSIPDSIDRLLPPGVAMGLYKRRGIGMPYYNDATPATRAAIRKLWEWEQRDAYYALDGHVLSLSR